VSPASLWFTKQYPIDKWIEFVNEVDENIPIYLLGAPNDKALCENIISQARKTNIVSLAGKLSFLQSAALMKGAVMNFVNDSAPMHLASATNAPVTAIFCSTVPAFGFGPLSDNSAIVESQSELPCRPCGLHGHTTCPEKHFLCARSINNSQLLIRINI
jgi:heptosyltransferase-2